MVQGHHHAKHTRIQIMKKCFMIYIFYSPKVFESQKRLWAILTNFLKRLENTVKELHYSDNKELPTELESGS